MLKTIKTKKNTTKYTLVALVAGFALLSVGSSYIHARSAHNSSNSNLSNITANTNMRHIHSMMAAPTTRIITASQL